MEKAVKRNLQPHWKNTVYVSTVQHGFLNSRSCLMLVLCRRPKKWIEINNMSSCVVNSWNAFPTAVTEAKSETSFKRKLDDEL